MVLVSADLLREAADVAGHSPSCHIGHHERHHDGVLEECVDLECLHFRLRTSPVHVCAPTSGADTADTIMAKFDVLVSALKSIGYGQFEPGTCGDYAEDGRYTFPAREKRIREMATAALSATESASSGPAHVCASEKGEAKKWRSQRIGISDDDMMKEEAESSVELDNDPEGAQTVSLRGEARPCQHVVGAFVDELGLYWRCGGCGETIARGEAANASEQPASIPPQGPSDEACIHGAIVCEECGYERGFADGIAASRHDEQRPSRGALMELFEKASARKAANKPHDPKEPGANEHLQAYFRISDEFDVALARCEAEMKEPPHAK